MDRSMHIPQPEQAPKQQLNQEPSQPPGADKPLGVLAALPGELAPLLAHAQERSGELGVRQWQIGPTGPRLAVCGVGKVAAATAAASLLAAGCRGLLVVGTGGGISADLEVGDLVLGSRCIQHDLAVREGRMSPASPQWRRDWSALAEAREGLILSGDRPVMGGWSRRKLRRAYPETALVDMECAAVARVCEMANRPFAALKVVTDLASWGSKRSFLGEYKRLAGAAAETLMVLSPGPGLWEGGPAFGLADG